MIRFLIISLILSALAACKPRQEISSATKEGEPIPNIDLRTKFFGFDPDPSQDEKAYLGMKTTFAGLGFRMRIPEKLFQKLIVLERQRQWKVYGNPPSPPSRSTLGARRGAGRVLAMDARGTTSNGRDVGMNFAVSEENGKKYVSFTCFQCHAGVVAGMTVAGLGNSHIDQYALTQNLVQYAKFRDLWHHQGDGLAQSLVNLVGRETVAQLAGLDDRDLKHLRWFSLYSETILRPALDGASARGDDFGPYPVWQLMARLKNPGTTGFDLHRIGDTNANLMARERLVSNMPLGPVDRRPWWLRKHDRYSYVYGDTLAESYAGKDFAINFTVPHDRHNDTYEERAKDTMSILDFAYWTKSPPYPYDRNDPRADAQTIERGRQTYNRDCARCHGKVEQNDADSNKPWTLKYKSVEYSGNHSYWQNTCLTDVLYSSDRDAQGNPVDPAWTAEDDTDLTYSCALIKFNALAKYAGPINPYFKDRGVPFAPEVYNPTKPGYRAPPLVGIWASAPYLHNGSVPTLRDLFNDTETLRAQIRANAVNNPFIDESLIASVKARPMGWERVLEVSKEASYDDTNVGMYVVPYFKGPQPGYDPFAMPQDPGKPYDHVDQVRYRLLYDTRLPGKSAKGATTCGSNLNTSEKNDMLAFLKELVDANVEPDPEKCPHPPRARVSGGEESYAVHALCR